MGTYVVCQTDHCRQTYPMEHFGVITKETRDVACDKCGGILVDSNGRATFSQNDAVIPVISIKTLKENATRRLEKKQREYAQLGREIKELEEEIAEY